MNFTDEQIQDFVAHIERCLEGKGKASNKDILQYLFFIGNDIAALTQRVDYLLKIITAEEKKPTIEVVQ